MCAVTPNEQRPATRYPRADFSIRGLSDAAIAARPRRGLSEDQTGFSPDREPVERTYSPPKKPRHAVTSRDRVSFTKVARGRYPTARDLQDNRGSEGLQAASDAALRDRGPCRYIAVRRSAQGRGDRDIAHLRRTEGAAGECIFHRPEAQLSWVRYGKHFLPGHHARPHPDLSRRRRPGHRLRGSPPEWSGEAGSIDSVCGEC